MLRWIEEDDLVWCEEKGIGYYPVKVSPSLVYNEEYWNRYCQYRDTEVGVKLTKARVDLVKMFTPKDSIVVDVGIGNGDFVLEMDCFGTDINPYAVNWLKKQGRYFDLNDRTVDVMTMWDVIEHMDDPEPILNKVKDLIFISTPVYNSAKHVTESKHFRKDEHFWYFRIDGMKKFMLHYGFQCIHVDFRESDLGRDSIGSFVFKRISRT